MINAPSGARGLGHVGWAFQDPGTNQWYFGATENKEGNRYVPPGGNTQSWIASGRKGQMLAAFKNAGHFHPSDYYTKWRCRTIENPAVGAALIAERKAAASGYNVLSDNCLTKAIAILNAYGEELGYPGYLQAPNNYFDNLGNSAWGPIRQL
jgi:hypothetical protein